MKVQMKPIILDIYRRQGKSLMDVYGVQQQTAAEEMDKKLDTRQEKSREE